METADKKLFNPDCRTCKGAGSCSIYFEICPDCKGTGVMRRYYSVRVNEVEEFRCETERELESVISELATCREDQVKMQAKHEARLANGSDVEITWVDPDLIHPGIDLEKTVSELPIGTTEEKPVLVTVNQEALQSELNFIMNGFGARMRSVVEDTLGAIEIGCLPYLSEYAEYNVRSRVESELRGLMMGQKSRFLDLSGADVKYIRWRIFEEHKEEIVAALGRDFEKEIEDYREKLELARRK